jgi:hypothetical protein
LRLARLTRRFLPVFRCMCVHALVPTSFWICVVYNLLILWLITKLICINAQHDRIVYHTRNLGPWLKDQGHNLRSPFKMPLYLVLPIVFSFRAHAFFYLGAIRRFSWKWHYCVNLKVPCTAVWTHLRMFSIFKISPFSC